MNRYLSSHIGTRFLLFCAITLLFTVTWMSLVNARPEQSPNAQTISISGPPTVDFQQEINYTIAYSGVITNTGGVRYFVPSGFTISNTIPITSTIPSSHTQGVGLIWHHPAIGVSGTITVTGAFNTSPCQPGVYTHTVGIYDTHPSPTAPASNSTTTTLICPGQVSGTVFNDRNRNGTQNTRDNGLANISLSMVSITDTNTTRSATTDSNGFYQFTNTAAGTYSVTVTIPETRINTTPPSSRRVIVTDVVSGTSDFGLGRRPRANAGLLAGVLCFDVNGDGRCSRSEFGLTLRILLILNGGRSPDGGEVVAEIISDSDGSYAFEDVPVGSYQMRPDLPPELVGSVPAEIPVTVSDQGATLVNFGTASNKILTGVVYSDQDGNGTQSPLEPGHSGVEVTLKRDETIVSTTTTNVYGQYQFDDIDSNSSYTVEISRPSGLVATTPTTQSIAPRNPANFGLVDSNTLIGGLFVDLNGNGLQDPTEVGLSGVSIEVSGGSLTEAMRTTTSDSGLYKFSNLPVGEYMVTQTEPSGYVNHDSNTKSVTMVANDSASANFVLLPDHTIVGMAFNDLNGNGTQDRAEPAFSGVTIQLLDSNRNVVNTTTTNANGNYQFSSLANGEYTVKVTEPTGLSATTSGEVSATISNSKSAVAIFGLGQVPTAVSEPSLIDPESTTNRFWLVMLLSVAFVVVLKFMPRRKNS